MARGNARVPASAALPAHGVEIVVSGWRPGFEKVRFTQIVRDCGTRLSEALRLTGDVLDGKTVRMRFEQFASAAAARSALQRIGIAEVHEP